MVNFLESIKIVLKFKKKCIDNSTFQLHYKLTTIFLVWSCIIISTKQFFGEPIKCLSNSKNNEATEVHNTYCWIHGTYTLRNHSTQKIGKEAIAPGVGMVTKYDVEYYHMYYQWVCVFLLIKAMMFYAPRYLWKSFEGGRIESLTNEMGHVVVAKDKWNDTLKDNIVQYFTNMNGHNFYAARFVFCEFLNLFNVVFQIFLLNVFLGGSFSNYGPAVASFFYSPNLPDTVDPMAWMFPKVTKCTFRYFGSSGSLQNLELICILPLNVINEKLFVILWFWYVLLAFLSLISVLFGIMTFCSYSVRAHLTANQIRMVPKFEIKNIVKKLNVGDWFLLYQLGKNIDPRILKEILFDIDTRLEKKTVII